MYKNNKNSNIKMCCNRIKNNIIIKYKLLD